LADFNARVLDTASACHQLGIGKSRLYQLRTQWLKNQSSFQPSSSGGNHRTLWTPEIRAFIKSFLPLQRPPNFQLVSDELLRLFNFSRSRSTVEAYAKKHFSQFIPAPERKPRTYRRFRRANAGELWQHDSSIHQWWPAPKKQTLLLTVDDHSGFNLAGSFVSSDTTWNHFQHFRAAFLAHGIPRCVYTDGLSLFGPSSSSDHSDPKSEFQRALRALEIAHLVAPTPQAKGKIERRFGTFQKRLVTLLSHANVRDWNHAEDVLQMEITRQNHTLSRSTAARPIDLWRLSQSSPNSAMRPAPPSSLLDLHLSLRCWRKVHNNFIDFDGISYEIAPTKRKSVCILFHPGQRFWVLESSTSSRWPPILASFSL